MLRFQMRAPSWFLNISALWALASSAQGQATNPPAGMPTTPSLAAESHWRIGAAFGYGQRTNPLIQSEDIPVIVDLDIAWFGKRWFFDNGDVGFTVFDS